MTSAISNDQIVALYESSNGTLSIDELCEAFDGKWKPAAIKIALLNGSSLYRQKVKDGEATFDSNDKDTAMSVLRQLMISADSDVVKFRAATLVFDEVTGKRKATTTAKNMNFSVTLINQQMIAAEKAIEIAKSKIVEIDPRHKHLKEISA